MDKTIGQSYNPLLNSQDWDILIVLDACRFDIFEKINKIKGKLRKRISFSSCTGEWIQSVRGEDLSRIVYFSANPLISKQRLIPEKLDIKFKEFFDVWDKGWDDTLKSVPPKAVVNAVINYRNRSTAGKLVAHFIQLHPPFIGDTKINELGYEQIRLREKGEDISNKVFEKLTVYQQVKDGKISYEHCMKGYEDNLKLVLDSLTPILKLPGRKVITADHGDCFGEDGVFAHPAESRHPLLVHVPWFEVL